MGGTKGATNPAGSIIITEPKKSINPGDDFYNYINGNWIQHAHIPSFISSYSVSEEIEDEVAVKLTKQMTECIKEVRVGGGAKIPDRNSVGTLAFSALQSGKQHNSVHLLKILVERLNCLRDLRDIATTLGDLVRYRIGTVVSVFASPESHHSRTVRLCIGSGTLGLPDVSYYKGSAPGKMRTLLAYINLLRKLGKMLDVPDLEIMASLESSAVGPLTRAFGDNEFIMTGSEISKKWSAIPWDAFWQSSFSLSPSEWASRRFIVTSRSWMSYLNRLFKTLSLKEWKIWFAGSIILHSLPILPPPFDDFHFELYGRRLKGQSEKIPQHILALTLCQEWLPVQLGRIYKECCLNKHTLILARRLVESVRDAAIKRIETADWMNSVTRGKAIKKIKKVYFGVGIPEKWPEEGKVQLVQDNLFQNILLLGEERTRYNLNLTKKLLDPTAWDDAVFSVNGYYFSEGNRLIIPGGILNSPFFDNKRSDGWNFGGLGAVVGHELTHAFDVDGKKYDEKGDAVNWWLPVDNREYNKKTKALISLFSETDFRGHSVNGLLTLSENIADLGGVAIALTALDEKLSQRKASDAQRKQELRDFFTAYAVSWRIKTKDAAALQSLIIDKHAPELLRVNLVVAQFSEWIEAFDIEEKNKMWIEPNKRIRIF